MMGDERGYPVSSAWKLSRACRPARALPRLPSPKGNGWGHTVDVATRWAIVRPAAEVHTSTAGTRKAPSSGRGLSLWSRDAQLYGLIVAYLVKDVQHLAVSRRVA